MKFKEMLELVYEGFELGILDNVNFNKYDSGARVIGFYYGGVSAEGDNGRRIWFNPDGAIPEHGIENSNELIEMVAATREAGSVERGFRNIIIGEQKELLKEVHEIVSRIEARMIQEN